MQDKLSPKNVPYHVQLIKSTELVPYPVAQQWMERRVSQIMTEQDRPCIWMLEHPETYTAGMSATEQDVLPEATLPIYSTRRGGKHTYHGPGQRVVYTIMDLKQLHEGRPDIRKFIYQLEHAVMQTLSHFGVETYTTPERIGIWVKHNGDEMKIAAVGLHVKRWITSHGIAINISPNLKRFTGIIPCGLHDFGVTSLHALGVEISIEEFDRVLQPFLSNSLGVILDA